MRFFEYFVSRTPSALTQLAADDYKQDLSGTEEEKALRAFELAWATRNFEIELYWKRATYFWTFIATTFAGYFLLFKSVDFSKPDPFDYIEVYVLACFGLILSFAWFFTNVGSKMWQRQWEAHIDLLEDRFTGPLYKTVTPTKTYSVSSINEIVSLVVVVIWGLLGAKYLWVAPWFPQPFAWSEMNWLVPILTVGVVLALFAMIFGHGRGVFSVRSVSMYRRDVRFRNPTPKQAD